MAHAPSLNLATRMLDGLSRPAMGCLLWALSAWCAVESCRADEPPAATGPTVQRPANRLAKETSPYLLLHAHNPVDWYPWGEEALAKARAEKKLIFLSIGYSSCYWCHVMERESFMDEEVAGELSKNYVCIKVDREERPDIDHIYMSALSLMGRQGGWPLTMILTPEARPIVGATYFPPRDKEVEVAGGSKQKVTGLLPFVRLVHSSWQKNPQELRDYADQVAAALRRSLRQQGLAAAPIAADLPTKAVAALAEQFDREYGGFSYSEANPRRPKFPEPANLLFLLNPAKNDDASAARKMLTVTLDHMARGGIRDHLGGGFHRYSTDRYWRIPHFEKMLYDNGQLATVYAEAFRLTGNGEYRRTAEELLAFVERELTAPEGAFYAALDAETDGDEGQYYVWTRAEITAALDNADARLVAAVYGTTGEPNFEERYVLELSRPLDEVARQQGQTVEELQRQLEAVHRRLLAVREKRERPRTDTKILTAWNGLMIAGFADAGRLLEREDFTKVAARAADFVLANLRTKEGRLRRSYAQGAAHFNAYLDDYSFLVAGLIALHKATGDARWLQTADELTRTQIEQFWDADAGGFYFTSADHEELLARAKDPVDGALPSGNAVAASNLVYLARELNHPEYLQHAERTLSYFSALLNENPGALPRMVQSWIELQGARQNAPRKTPAE